MKRFAPLLLVVLALAVPVAALADDSTPTATTTTSTPAQPPQAPQGTRHPFARMRLEILRLRIQLARVEYRVVCRDETSDACAQFTQTLVDRLTAVDQKVQAKMSSVGCASSSADTRCDLLSRVDARLQKLIAKLGSGSAPSTSDQSGLDQAASTLGGLNG